MLRPLSAYTMIELLVVTAIIAVVAALLAPAILSAKAAAKKTVCLSHQNQVAKATMLYLLDYDDTFMPVSYHPGEVSNSREDRTWVQLLLPYARSFSEFLCPSDTSRRISFDSPLDTDVVPGDLYAEYYQASRHTNLGFNYMALSPVIRLARHWVAVPRNYSEIERPDNTMLFVDSVWSLTPTHEPAGGGNWLVAPPCRYEERNGDKVDLLAADGKSFGDVYSVSDGWDPLDGTKYGGAWPWHTGRMNVVFVGSEVVSRTPGQLGIGCDVQAHWNGDVTSTADYIWLGL